LRYLVLALVLDEETPRSARP